MHNTKIITSMKQGVTKLILSVCTAFPLILSAQIALNSSSNLLRPGDKLIKQQVSYKDPGQPGTSVKWDFSDLEVTVEGYELTYDTVRSHFLMGREHRTMYYYDLQSDTLLLQGYENPMTLFTYRKPELQLVFPFPYGRKATGYFDALGQYCGQLNMHVAGKSTITGDATGEIILPGGDTLRHVLRLHSCKLLLEHRLPGGRDKELNDSLCPVLSPDSIDFYLANDSSVLQVDAWKWYSDGYRYPVFESMKGTVLVCGKAVQSFTTSFYYPPHEQYYALGYDAESQASRDAAEGNYWNGYKADNTAQSSNSYNDEKIHYNYSIDGQGNLQITYTVAETSDLSFILFDLQGRQLSEIKQQAENRQNYQERIPLQSYPKGEYLLRIVCGGSIYGEKILNQ